MVALVPLLTSRLQDLISGRARGVGSSLCRLALSVASGPYGSAVHLRNWCYDRGWLPTHRPPVPVISVGNLTAGGTGKTPCVEYLARFLQARGLRPAVLSRGYRGNGRPNDEALILEANLPDVPHLQGKDRVTRASQAVRVFGADVLILDDGFQHRRLRRDLDLVLIDAMNPWGHGRLLPRGLLREPISSLRRADAVIVTRLDQAQPAEIERIIA